jgi:hypothetical protein
MDHEPEDRRNGIHLHPDLFILVPFGLVVLFFPAQPHYAVSGEPVHGASQAAGITVVNVTNVTCR